MQDANRWRWRSRKRTKHGSASPCVTVLIASSSADEESQESDDIGASFFTHYLASGLLGDADSSGDGKVTLAEAYTYAYARTVGETAETRAGAQRRSTHAHHHRDLHGSNFHLPQHGAEAAHLAFA